jgi:SAM-dependent methyltransferase
MKINFGSGEHALPGYINVDWQEGPNTDVVHDLNVFPYPWKDNSVEEIEMSHCLEHLDRVFAVMKELHRIMAPGGRLHIKVPHFSRGFTHAEHTHGFDVTFPTYFNPKFKTSGYYGFELICEKMELHWEAFFHLMPYMGYGPITIGAVRAVSAVISFFANLAPGFCSRIWCFWVGGFNEIEFVFRKPAA